MENFEHLVRRYGEEIDFFFVVRIMSLMYQLRFQRLVLAIEVHWYYLWQQWWPHCPHFRQIHFEFHLGNPEGKKIRQIFFFLFKNSSIFRKSHMNHWIIWSIGINSFQRWSGFIISMRARKSKTSWTSNESDGYETGNSKKTPNSQSPSWIRNFFMCCLRNK